MAAHYFKRMLITGLDKFGIDQILAKKYIQEKNLTNMSSEELIFKNKSDLM